LLILFASPLTPTLTTVNHFNQVTDIKGCGDLLFKVVGLVARVDQKKAVKLAKESTAHIEDRGVSVFLEPSLAKRAKKIAPASRVEEVRLLFLRGESI